MFGRNKTPPEQAIRQGDLIKACRVYLHRERPQAIVATCFRDGALMMEDGDDITVVSTQSDIDFGEAVRDAFVASSRRDMSKYHGQKRTEWPVFKISGATSVAQFERDHIQVSIEGLNTANIMVRLETEPVQWGVSLTCLCNPLVVEMLGGEINKLRAHFLKWEGV